LNCSKLRLTLKLCLTLSKPCLDQIFQFRNEEVAEDLVEVVCPRDYFLRNRKCINAWRKGRMSELACVMGPHPIEVVFCSDFFWTNTTTDAMPMQDVLHIHAWLHTHIEHCGRPPTEFYVMPTQKTRSAELVPGRIYPVTNSHDETGVVCVGLGGYAFAFLRSGLPTVIFNDD